MPMVQWLDYRQLIDTAWRVVLSGVFGAWADKRELQAALGAGSFADRSHRSEVWIDYVSDLGDGFDSTYSVASLLSSKQLELAWDGKAYRTQRGKLLVMGGDQVYPTSKISDYENRFLGPYQAALPWTSEDEDLELLAVPGNHDWYDGLTNFMRIFCQGKHIGGRQTHQTRSYFAVKLHRRWWLWGIDVQLDDYIDDPQMRYFRDVVGPDVKKGDHVILCTAKPAWVGAGQGEETAAYRNLDYFERKVVKPTGARVVVHLSGDSHRYVRYSERGGIRQRITAGGGGAFMHPTHWEPEALDLPEEKGRRQASYERRGVFPPPEESRRFPRRLWRLPVLNPSFAVLVGTVYVVLALLAHWFDEASRAVQTAERCDVIVLLCLTEAHAETATTSAGAVAAVLVLGRGLVGFATKAGRRRWWLGTLHVVVHVLTLLALAAAFSSLAVALDWDGWTAGAGLLATVGIGGAAVGSLVMAGYLWATHRFLRVHGNETYSAMRITEYKNFLRLHIDSQGALTIFPVGLARVCSKWAARPDDSADSPWLSPANGDLHPQLIEAPVRLAPPQN